jgi:predicted phosphodiesterase
VKIAVLSDIHGNLAALDAVLSDIHKVDVDEIISLGDNIGYGPDSNAVMELICELGIPSVLGNHEMPVIDKELLKWFNPIARQTLILILDQLTGKALEMIRQQPRFISRFGARFVHGFPPDSSTLYLFQMRDDRVIRYLSDAAERICFVGHTHELCLVVHDGGKVIRNTLSKETVIFSPDCSYIVNIGSVGQPRDGNNNAKYVIWDTLSKTLEVRFVPYNIQLTVDRIRALGLPESNASRLF